jgi:hypothetical protein
LLSPLFLFQIREFAPTIQIDLNIGGQVIWIVAGMHHVNRLKYFVSNEEWKDENEQYPW